MGFLFPDSGHASVFGCPPGDVRAKRQIGFLPENFAFYSYLTGERLLRLHMQLAGMDLSHAEARISPLLAKVGLSGFEDLKIGKYSRGMAQRVGLAQALLADPQLLVLDEPTSGLDPAGRKEVLDLLAGLKNEGKTVFLSSHILPEVEQICDRVIIIDRGRLLQTGKLSDLLVSGNRIEIEAEGLPEEANPQFAERGVTIEPTARGFRILAEASRKREIVESIWSAGGDVISLNPVRGTLEQVFLDAVSAPKESQ